MMMWPRQVRSRDIRRHVGLHKIQRTKDSTQLRMAIARMLVHCSDARRDGR